MKRAALIAAFALSIIYVLFLLAFAFTNWHPFPPEPHHGAGTFAAKPWIFNVTMWVLIATAWTTYGALPGRRP